jgi:hypothetical protein
VAVPAEPLPLDVLVLLDRSASMGAAASGVTQWSAIGAGLAGLVRGVGAHVGVGLQFFPVPRAEACAVQSCVHDDDCGAGCGPCVSDPGAGAGAGYGPTDSCVASDHLPVAVPIQSTATGYDAMARAWLA